MLYLAAVAAGAFAELLSQWLPALAGLPLSSTALWLVIGFDACVVALFLIDGIFARATCALTARRERPRDCRSGPTMK
jgi:hypothetical protein